MCIYNIGAKGPELTIRVFCFSCFARENSNLEKGRTRKAAIRLRKGGARSPGKQAGRMTRGDASGASCSRAGLTPVLSALLGRWERVAWRAANRSAHPDPFGRRGRWQRSPGLVRAGLGAGEAPPPRVHDVTFGSRSASSSPLWRGFGWLLSVQGGKGAASQPEMQWRLLSATVKHYVPYLHS